MAAKKKATAKAKAAKKSAPSWTPWPATATSVDAKTLAAAYAKVRPSLAKDPLFTKDAADYGVSLADLDARMKKPPPRLEEGDALYLWLDGADQYRYAALRVLLEAIGGAKPTKLNGAIVVPAGGVRVVRGDARVDGNLILESQAMLVVLGKLTVTGVIATAPYDYSMLGAREIRCAAGLSFGELLALDRIVVRGDFYFGGNDYSSRAPLYEGRVLVDFERGNFFSKTKTKSRITEWDFPAAAKALGVDAEGELADIFRAKLLGANA